MLECYAGRLDRHSFRLDQALLVLDQLGMHLGTRIGTGACQCRAKAGARDGSGYDISDLDSDRGGS
jgi:hypothetical protein